MKTNQIGAFSGILFTIVTVPLVMMSVGAVGNETDTDAAYVANILEKHESIQRFAGVGLLTILLLLVHLEWLTNLLAKHADISSKLAKSCGQFAAIGFILSYGLALACAYGAGTWPDQTVRTIGIMAPNIWGSFLVGLAFIAGAIALLGWKGKFPKWIALVATFAALVTVVGTAAGAPGVPALLLLVWLPINSLGMFFYSRKNP